LFLTRAADGNFAVMTGVEFRGDISARDDEEIKLELSNDGHLQMKFNLSAS